MNVRAQGLLNGAKFVIDTFGREHLAAVLRAVGPAVRDRYTSAADMTWHPVEELVEFVSVTDRLLGRGDGRLCERIGEAGAEANAGSILFRIAFYLADPPSLMRRLAALWSQYNDEGQMTVVALDRHKLVLKLHGARVLHRPFCQIITGWLRHHADAAGARNVECRLAELVERGNASCTWETKWLL